jgi:hypothetical protein
MHGDDLFVAGHQGQWWVAPGGQSWAPLASSPIPALDLRFGDVDNDGKTDVLAIQGGKLGFFSAGLLPFKSLDLPLSSMNGIYFADFDGDGITDAGKYVSFSSGGVTLEAFAYAKQSRNAFATADFGDGHAAIGRFQGGTKAQRITWDDRSLDLTNLGGSPQRVSRQEMR